MTELAALFARPGANDLDWEDPHLPGRRIVLRSARPAHVSPQTPVLFVHHGVNRNGGDYRDYWLPLVDEADLMVIAPEFPAADFPGSAWYNFGNRSSETGAPNPRDSWTYNTNQRVFDALRAQGLTEHGRYGVWGHSAGGQFVHRMLSLGLRAGVAAAATANAGTYAMPDPEVDFPYGLGGTGMDEDGLASLLTFRLTVMAGTADTDSGGEHFPREPEAMRQGTNRYERAHAYIATARRQARRLGLHCAWTIVDVPGVAHDGELMSAAAAPILSAALHAI